MAAVSVHKVTKQFGTQVVLQEVAIELRSGETAGLIGANGAGKTTLFRLIAGELTPDTGSVTRSRGLEVGLLRQEPDISLDRSLHDEVGSAFDELLGLEAKLQKVSEQMAACADPDELSNLMAAYERVNARFITAGGHTFEARLNEILGGLGFRPADYALPMSVLSGGQKCRAALAKMLLQDHTFLLLDEPTNHLDIDAVRWLEKFLAGHHGGAVVISHDRYLLDRICDRIIELDRARVTNYPGNYSNYAQTKELRILTQQRDFAKDSEFIKKERAFIAKHLAGQRTKEAQGRRKRLERMLADGEFVTEAPTHSRGVSFKFEKAAAQGTTVLRCDELGMAFDENTLFTNLTLQVHAGQRFGITGPNGVGKTTLLRIAMGEITPQSGSFLLDPKLTVGYYSQEHGGFDAQRDVVGEIRAHQTGLTEHDARTLLARYRFTGDDVFKSLGSLSGGEQARVRLCKLIMASPDVLVLDEPTNHLDIPSREVLEDALTAFTGTIIVVSHDRYFLDRIVDRLLVLRSDLYSVYEGNYSYYLEQIEEQRAADKPKTRRKPAEKRSSGQDDQQNKNRASRFDRLSIDELEAMVVERETELAMLQQRFGVPEVYQNPELLAELREHAAELAAELAEVDQAWQERVDESG